MTTDKSKDDDLMKRLERLQAQAGAKPATPATPRDLSPVEEAERALAKAKEASVVFNEISGVWGAVKKPFIFAWGYIKPTYELGKYGVEKTMDTLSFMAPVVRPIAQPLWNGYKALFNRAAYTKDEDGERTVLNKPRAAAAVVLSAMMAWTAATQGVPFAMHTTYDLSMMATTMHQQEEIYTNGANPVDETDDVFYVKTCEELPCDSTSNSKYFRIRDNFPLAVYRLATKGQWFRPEDVASAIPEGTAKCTADYYGVRLRAIGMYPLMTAIRCTPLEAGPHNVAPAQAQAGPQI